MNEFFTNCLNWFTSHWETILFWVTTIIATYKSLSAGVNAIKNYGTKIKDLHTTESINKLLKFMEDFAKNYEQNQAEFEQKLIDNTSNQIRCIFNEFNEQKREVAKTILGIEPPVKEEVKIEQPEEVIELEPMVEQVEVTEQPQEEPKELL